MKHLLFVISILLIATTTACNSNNSKASGNAGNSESASSKNSSAQGSFSATIDGEAISGGAIDELQLQNTAFIYPTADNSGKRLLFFLYSDKKGDMAYSFRFSVPDKTGAFTKKDRDDQPFDITLDFQGGDNSRYGAEDVTVNIISVNDKNITGTFSGKFLLGVDTPNGTKKEVTVTDGKFDIPFSTGNIKPE
ncbi:MAG: hypothetical protein JST71_02720 [Bacteroidetes bacterium]|nr:hypothetical protein [Bacteroidota bacterium]MBS1756360.1 hypothetical protein [Bacteroidota bacterium]MBS1922294.1 hypothetical protein [Bacteroidota bacterium]